MCGCACGGQRCMVRFAFSMCLPLLEGPFFHPAPCLAVANYGLYVSPCRTNATRSCGSRICSHQCSCLCLRAWLCSRGKNELCGNDQMRPGMWNTPVFCELSKRFPSSVLPVTGHGQHWTMVIMHATCAPSVGLAAFVTCTYMQRRRSCFLSCERQR